MTQSTIQAGLKVRLKADPGRAGYLTGKTREVNGRTYWQVDFLDGSFFHAEDQLETAESPLDPLERLRQGSLGRAADLRRTLTHVRLSGRLANLIYSMETTNTDFYAYQFKPVLKMLNTPTKGILIADEVGLGKTIEAGLIWTELRSRYEDRRLMVLCPAVLREKWRAELHKRFGIDAEVLNANQALEKFRKVAAEDNYASFAIICSMQGMRPRRNWEDANEAANNTSELARFLDNRKEEDSLIDLLVIDEAHYLRNPESMTSALGQLLCAVSQRVLLLSATPIHLKNADLYHLLNLIDPDTFNQPTIFDSILEANAPIVKAREALTTGRINAAELLGLLQEAKQNPYLEGNRQLQSLIDDLQSGASLDDHDYRSKLVYRLDGVNLLNHVVTRTRKREVQEWRVLREATPQKVTMSEPERQFYIKVTTLLRDFCKRYQQHEGFLLVTPQRQMASSMPAALRYWQQRKKLYPDEYFEDFGVEIEEEPPGPVIQEILRHVEALGDLKTLWENDSKFKELAILLQNFFTDHPSEKVIVFSYFTATLEYLAERLTEKGLTTIVLSGGQGIDKDQILERFASPQGPQILLSSEVGSEGVDLQFCRVVINYDLPWNPMRVEQRIGRVDRIGQKAAKISIWNLMYDDTIDSRIYDRLYGRLEIFERTLGGLEAILGDELRKLTNELLREQLTPDQERERIEQTSQALVNLRNEEQRLEDEAASLVAHGDYILNQVKAARELNRWVSGADIKTYVIPFFKEYFVGCQFQQVSTDDVFTYDISLSNEAKQEFDEYIKARRLPYSTSLMRIDPAPIRCRFENKVTGHQIGRPEIISQFHPLVRFISHKLNQERAYSYPAVAVSVSSAHLPEHLRRGVYVFAVQRWSVEGLQVRERLFFAVENFDQPDLVLSEDDAERLVVIAASHGRDWLEARNILDLPHVEEVAAKLCLGTAGVLFDEYVNQAANENNDRADVQEKTVQRHLENQRQVLNRIKAGHLAMKRESLAKATDGRLQKLENRIQWQLQKINNGRETKRKTDDVCLGVIKVAEG